MPIDPSRIEVIDDRTAEMLRGMSPAWKLELANRMYLDARAMIRSALRIEHADWTTDRIEREVARRTSRGAS